MDSSLLCILGKLWHSRVGLCNSDGLFVVWVINKKRWASQLWLVTPFVLKAISPAPWSSPLIDISSRNSTTMEPISYLLECSCCFYSLIMMQSPLQNRCPFQKEGFQNLEFEPKLRLTNSEHVLRVGLMNSWVRVDIKTLSIKCR